MAAILFGNGDFLGLLVVPAFDAAKTYQPKPFAQESLS
jgi:hypothetical protein